MKLKIALLTMSVILGTAFGFGYSSSARAAMNCETCQLQYNYCLKRVGSYETVRSCQAKLYRCRRGCIWY